MSARDDYPSLQLTALPGTAAFGQLEAALAEIDRLRGENQVLSRLVGASIAEPAGLRDDLYYEGGEYDGCPNTAIIERLIEAVVGLRAWTHWQARP